MFLRIMRLTSPHPDIHFFLCLPTAAAAAKSLQSRPTLCNPMDSSPPGSSVHRILQARILEWVAPPRPAVPAAYQLPVYCTCFGPCSVTVSLAQSQSPPKPPTSAIPRILGKPLYFQGQLVSLTSYCCLLSSLSFGLIYFPLETELYEGRMCLHFHQRIPRAKHKVGTQ